ncbi:DUF1572 domain-containing protein [soil metagenome]
MIGFRLNKFFSCGIVVFTTGIHAQRLRFPHQRFFYYLGIEKTFDQLGENNFYFTPDNDCNSISIIIQHMHGNMLSRWTNFLTDDGEKSWRKRDEEFEEGTLTKNELMKLWEEGWGCCLKALKNLEAGDLEKTIYIRQQPLAVTEAIHRQIAHYSYHVGQIIYIGKMLRKERWTNLSMPKNK